MIPRQEGWLQQFQLMFRFIHFNDSTNVLPLSLQLLLTVQHKPLKRIIPHRINMDFGSEVKSRTATNSCKFFGILQLILVLLVLQVSEKVSIMEQINLYVKLLLPVSLQETKAFQELKKSLFSLYDFKCSSSMFLFFQQVGDKGIVNPSFNVGGQFDPNNGGRVPITPFVGTGVNVGDGQGKLILVFEYYKGHMRSSESFCYFFTLYILLNSGICYVNQHFT